MSGKMVLVVMAVAVMIFAGLVTMNDLGSGASATEDVAAVSKAPSTGFIKFEGIDGEATHNNYEGWSEILGFWQGMSIPGEEYYVVIFSRLPIVKSVLRRVFSTERTRAVSARHERRHDHAGSAGGHGRGQSALLKTLCSVSRRTG